MRGEKTGRPTVITPTMGSPPHARGKGMSVRVYRNYCRITPACAGKRPWGVRADRTRWDHPRMRGEKIRVACTSSGAAGSPPHARGKVEHFVDCLRAFGITPACAGKRRRRNGRSQLDWDHPRMRGEKGAHSASLLFVLGSPPHARGKGGHIGGNARRAGITPACAGKSEPGAAPE